MLSLLYLCSFKKNNYSLALEYLAAEAKNEVVLGGVRNEKITSMKNSEHITLK